MLKLSSPEYMACTVEGEPDAPDAEVRVQDAGPRRERVFVPPSPDRANHHEAKQSLSASLSSMTPATVA